MSGSNYPMFLNDRGVPEIRIGVREFECIGVSPPLDHPHIYINMRDADTILCRYCATRFRFDPRLTPFDADPPNSLFAVAAVIELRRLFPGVTDNRQARECVRMIAGWRLSEPDQPPRLRTKGARS